MNELKTQGNNESNLTYMVGQNVEHSRFGKGKITKIDGVNSNQKATIFFPHHGIKNLLLQFANLRILDQE